MIKKLFIVLSLIFITSPSYAVTRFVVRVNNGGATEDYNTLALAESAMDDVVTLIDGTVKTGSWDTCTGTCTGNTVAGGAGSFADTEAVTWDAGASTGTLIHLNVHSSQYLIDVLTGTLDDNDVVDDGDGNTFAINGTPDSAIISIQPYKTDGTLTAGVTINGFTTNNTNFVEISPPVSERHTGTEGTGVVVDVGAVVDGIFIGGSCFNCVVEYLEITGSTMTGTGAGVNCNISNSICRVRNNIIHDLGAAGAQTRGIRCNRRCIVHNNFIYDIRGTGIREDSGFATNMIVSANTIWNMNQSNTSTNRGIHINSTSNSNNVFNNLVLEGTNATINYQFTGVTTGTNGSSDTTGNTGFTSLVAATELTNPVSTSAANLHLLSTATILNDGTNLGSSNGLNFDIDGYDRIANGVVWDIGADEFVGAAPAATRRVHLIH